MTLYLPPSFTRLIAALRSYEEIKERCRGRYDFEHGGHYCKCEENEVCQVVLSEVLGKDEKVTAEKKFTLAFKQLEEAGVIKVRRIKNPPGKPQVFYSLPDNWLEALEMAILRDVEKETERLEFDNIKNYRRELRERKRGE